MQASCCGENKRRNVESFDHVGHGEGLAASSYTEQNASFLPSSNCLTSSSIAPGWSPDGSNSLCKRKRFTDGCKCSIAAPSRAFDKSKGSRSTKSNQQLLGQRRAQTRRHHPKRRSWLGFAPTLDEDASKANRVRHWRAQLLQ